MTDTPEQVAATFTGAEPTAARFAAVLATLPDDTPGVLVVRTPEGGTFSMGSFVGSAGMAGMLTDSLGTSAQQVAALMPALIATYTGGSGGTGGAAMTGKAFTTITFAQATTDTHKAFDPATGIYTVPQDGLYDIDLRFRMADADMTGVSYGVGADTANQDSPAFAWTVGAPKRQGVQFRAAVPLKKGDSLRAFYYLDAANATYIAADLTILRVR